MLYNQQSIVQTTGSQCSKCGGTDWNAVPVRKKSAVFYIYLNCSSFMPKYQSKRVLFLLFYDTRNKETDIVFITSVNFTCFFNRARNRLTNDVDFGLYQYG